MVYIECPNSLDNLSDNERCKPKLFLAGGISGCSNWQQEFCQMVKSLDIVVMNPRRLNFDVTDPEASQKQIEWEFYHLNEADMISFWFPHETLCPITLYELGTRAKGKAPIFVGTHPEYKRREDVVIQLSLVIGKDFAVVSNLKDLAEQVEKHLIRRG